MTAADYGAVLAVWLAAVIAPGPDFAVVLRATLRGGRSGGLGATAGIVAGITVWTVLAAAGVHALLAGAPRLLAALQLVGGSYLIALGAPTLAASWRARRGAAATAGVSGGADADAGAEGDGMDAGQFGHGAARVGHAGSARREFLIGFAANLTNPKALVFFTAVFSSVVPATASGFELAVSGAMLIVAEAGWFGGIAVAASGPQLAGWMARHAAALSAITSGALVILGLLAAVSGVATLT